MDVRVLARISTDSTAGLVTSGARSAILAGVGFNPYRPQRRRSSDYLFVGAAFFVTTVLLVWALVPR